jgi:hypothetical protein
MNWEPHLPLTVATVAVIATLSVCTAGIERHLDAVARTNGAVELAGIETRLQAIEDYACSMDRSLQSIDTTMLPPSVRLHKDRAQPCPGDPGQRSP